MVAPSRSAPRRGIGNDARTDLPQGTGPHPGHPDRLSGRLRPRRGSRAGGVRHRRRPVATRRASPATRAWLMTAARNHATGPIRREQALAAKLGLLVASDPAEVPMNTTTVRDEGL